MYRLLEEIKTFSIVVVAAVVIIIERLMNDHFNIYLGLVLAQIICYKHEDNKNIKKYLDISTQLTLLFFRLK